MGDWERTVIKLEGTNKSLQIHMTKMLEQQAKASFEAGEAKGIKTVVEWVKSHSEDVKCDPRAISYFEDYRWIDETEWQSFLKEHGMGG